MSLRRGGVVTSGEQSFPAVSEHPCRGADEIGPSGLLGSKSDNHDGGVGQRDVGGDGRPATQRRALEAKGAEETEDAPEDALDARTFGELVGRPGRRQA